MLKSDTPNEAVTPLTKNPVDRWVNEGGATAGLVSEAVAAQIETLTPTERQILQCLGAAVVIGWNDLPTDMKRSLFKGAAGDEVSNPVSALRARIARFLHDHKDDSGLQ